MVNAWSHGLCLLSIWMINPNEIKYNMLLHQIRGTLRP